MVIPGNNGNVYRSYSLCGNGNPHDPWEITLKRFPDGVVSNYLYESVNVGMILHTLPPRGVFILPASLRPEQTFVFVAVGSGITPIRGLLRAIAALPPGSRPQAQLHYASRSAQETIYRDEILKLDWLRQKHYLRTEGPRVTPYQIFGNAYPLSRDAQWYICGPEEFNLQLRQALVSIGVPENLIHFEILPIKVGNLLLLLLHEQLLDISLSKKRVQPLMHANKRHCSKHYSTRMYRTTAR